MTPAQIQTLFVGIFTKLRDHASSLGIFEHVEGHALVNPPPTGIAVSFEFGTLDPDPAASGLAATSVDFTVTASVYRHMTTQPLDDLEAAIAGAAAALVGSLSGDFSLGDQVRNVDLMQVTARGGYVKLGGGETTFRTVVVTIPIGINDLFEQVS